MRRRKGFQHYMGDKLSQRQLTEKEVLDCYRILRHGKSKVAKEIARRMLIMSHIRLGFTHATRFISNRPNDRDEIVSEMVWGLVHGVDMISDGSLDDHNPVNVSGYLVRMMTGKMLNYIASKRPKMLPSPKRRKEIDGLELREIINLSITNEQEQNVIQLRVEGRNDAEIGAILGVTAARIGQIRTAVKNRLKEYLK